MKTFSHEESRERNEKYRTIFENSAVSLWEEDISKLRLKLSEMKAVGINLRAHIDAHPEFIQEAIHLIEVTDVNQASVLLFEADTKEHLLGPLNTVLDSVSRTALAETILAIDEGKGDIESESCNNPEREKTIPDSQNAHPLALPCQVRQYKII